MFFSRKRKPVVVALIASLAFMALAVWGWGMPMKTVGQFFLISLILIVGVMLAAMCLVFLIKLIQRLKRHD